MQITIFAGVGIALAAYAFLSLLGAFSDRRDRGRPSHALPLGTPQTALDLLTVPFTEARSQPTGLYLVADNLAAFNARMETIEKAGRSLDLQYYYWAGDITGKLLCRAVIAAADRGVRVRLLLDDINSARFDPTYLALDSHPHIEVRLFNPSRSRTSAIRRGVELVLKYVTSTRRMHNKNWIADGRLAIIGGRNIGDAYFNASNAANFQDVDLLVAGEAVDQAEAIFDQYWNSHAALPIRSLHRIRKPKLAKFRRRLDASALSREAKTFVDTSAALAQDETLATWLRQLTWVARADVVADPPEKALRQHLDKWIVHRINELIQDAHQNVRIISPYFIPGRTGSSIIQSLLKKGAQVSVLTNSLAATDVIAVHGAYSRYRMLLVSAGVAIHELKPNPSRTRASVFGSRTASLHTKSIVVDRAKGFVGSFNIDPRSASINTEMGIIFEDAKLAAEIDQLFERFASPHCSFAVSLESNRLRWSAVSETNEEHFEREPLASRVRLLVAAVVRWLPIESQL